MVEDDFDSTILSYEVTRSLLLKSKVEVFSAKAQFFGKPNNGREENPLLVGQ